MQYKFQGQPLNLNIAATLTLFLFAGTPTIKAANIKKGVIEYHKSQGGLEPNGPDSAITANALAKLKELGYAERPQHGYWRILPIYDSHTTHEE